MKKAVFIAATLGSASAFAQSSITLFGVADASVAFTKGSLSSSKRLISGSNTATRWGFRGSEDLGGGLRAEFWLEAQYNIDDGTGAASNTNNQASGAPPSTAAPGISFNRRSFVSLVSDSLGELRLGRDYTPQFWNHPAFDPFGAVGLGISQAYSGNRGGLTAARASNSISYLLPDLFGGFYGQYMYYMGENRSEQSNYKDGTGSGIRLGYKSGALHISFAYGKTSYLSGDTTSTNIGGSYDFGVVSVMGLYSREKVEGPAADGRGWIVGAILPVGVQQFKIAYSAHTDNSVGEPAARKLVLGYVYNLSKRTAVYTHWVHVSNKNGSNVALSGATTAPNRGSSGYEFGLRTTF